MTTEKLLAQLAFLYGVNVMLLILTFVARVANILSGSSYYFSCCYFSSVFVPRHQVDSNCETRESEQRSLIQGNDYSSRKKYFKLLVGNGVFSGVLHHGIGVYVGYILWSTSQRLWMLSCQVFGQALYSPWVVRSTLWFSLGRTSFYTHSRNESIEADVETIERLALP